MAKRSRHIAIKEILTTGHITTQAELKKKLQKKGFTVTQATLSRDLNELGVSRISEHTGHRYVYTADSSNSGRKTDGVRAQEIVRIQHNENLIVIITLPGCANAVAQWIDAQRHSNILGTLAGDDTILVVPVSVKRIKTVIRYLHHLTE